MSKHVRFVAVLVVVLFFIRPVWGLLDDSDPNHGHEAGPAPMTEAQARALWGSDATQIASVVYYGPDCQDKRGVCGVGAVYKRKIDSTDWVLSHCLGGPCDYNQPYDEYGKMSLVESLSTTEAQALVMLDFQKAVEGNPQLLVSELKLHEEHPPAKSWWERLFSAADAEAACPAGTSVESYYCGGSCSLPVYTMPTVIITASRGSGGYSYGGSQYNFGQPGGSQSSGSGLATSSTIATTMGKAYSPVVAITTAVKAAVAKVLTVVQEVLYPGSTDPRQPGDPVNAVGPFGILGAGTPKRVFIPDGGGTTHAAETAIWWFKKADGTPVAGMIMFEGNPRDASKIANIPTIMKDYGTRLGWTPVNSPIIDYVKAGGPGKVLP